MKLRTHALVALLLAGHAAAQGAEPVLVHEDWYILSIEGAPAGYAVSRLDRVEQDGETVLRLTDQSRLSMGRLGATVDIETETVQIERPDGSLISSSTESDISRRESLMRVEFRDGRAWIEMTVAGRTRELDRECPTEAIGPNRARELVREKLGEADARFYFTIWSADIGDFTDVDVHVIGPEEIELAPGDVRELVRVESEVEKLGMKVTSWYADDGREQRTLLRAAGLEIVSRRATREEAQRAADSEAEIAPEVFTPTMVAEPFFLPDPRRATRALVELRARDEEFRVAIPESERQRTIRREDDGRRILELRATAPAPGAGGRRPVTDPPPDLAPFLAASSAVQCDHEGIRATALELVADETEAWGAARLLERWVEGNVTEKTLDVGFASALEVFEDRAGDCTEHAVLLCALCRAAGIPTRIAMGVLYIGGSWAGHAWNEVWIDGTWYALDATLGLGGADALRLTLVTMSLDDAASASEFAGLVANVGSIDLRVLELDVGRRLQPEQDHGRMVDGRYVDRLYGLSLRVPDAMEVELGRPEAGIGFELLKAKGRAMRLSVRAYDASPDGSWPTFLGDISGDERSVDGRPALRVATGSDSTRRILVRSGTTVFEFVFRGGQDGAAEAVEEILQSVDFDL